MENSEEFFDFGEINETSQTVYETSSINSDASASLTDNTNKRHFSEIWEFYEKVEWNSGREKKTAKCIVKGCRHAPFACGYEGTTRPLWRHLESSHRAIYKNTEDYKKKSKISSGQSIEDMLKNVSHIFNSAFVLNTFIIGFFSPILATKILPTR